MCDRESSAPICKTPSTRREPQTTHSHYSSGSSQRSSKSPLTSSPRFSTSFFHSLGVLSCVSRAAALASAANIPRAVPRGAAAMTRDGVWRWFGFGFGQWDDGGGLVEKAQQGLLIFEILCLCDLLDSQGLGRLVTCSCAVSASAASTVATPASPVKLKSFAMMQVAVPLVLVASLARALSSMIRH